MPAVQLGLFVFGFVAASLGNDPFGFGHTVASGFLHGVAQRAHLARDLTVQAAHDGALTFDDFAHAFELAGMGVTPSLEAQQLAFFGIGLLELDAFR